MKRRTIRTAYQGATDTRGSRVVARGFGTQATIPYDYALNPEQVHERAARALAERVGATLAPGPWQGTPTGWIWNVTTTTTHHA